ncbi:MAG: ATP-binding protein [Algoriphagus sp.]|nr:ATP-binding protein [Algoriphagus sp.]
MLRFLWLLSGFILIQGLASGQEFKFNAQIKGVKLPGQTILQIEQDTLGRMWFSTARGIFFSDGILTETLPDSIHEKFMHKIGLHKDQEGIMWIYSSQGTPNLLSVTENGFEKNFISGEMGNRFSQFIRFFSFGKGLEKIYFMATDYELLFWKEGGKEKVLIDLESKKTGRLASVRQIDNQFILFFDNNSFIWKENGMVPFVIEGIKLPAPPVIIDKLPGTGDYYFLGPDYLAKGPAPDQPTELVDKGFQRINFPTVADFGLFFQGTNVFYHYNSQLRKKGAHNPAPLELDIRPLIKAYSISSAMVDREGILWIGSGRGMVNLNSLLFLNYGAQYTELLGEEISAIAPLGKGEFLFGFNNGIQHFSRKALSTIYQDSFPAGNPTRRIVNFSKEAEGKIWFSLNYGGVGNYTRETGKIRIFPPPSGMNISSVQVSGDSLLVLSPYHLFVSSIKDHPSELFKKDLKDEIIEVLGDANFFMRKAEYLSDGRILILRASSRHGAEIELAQNQNLLVVNGFDFLETEPGKLLLGTEKGLKIYENGEIRDFEVNGKKIERPIFALLKDRKNRVWAGTDEGLFVADEDKIVQYDESNGLIGNEINRGALVLTESGNVMIGTTKGFSIYFTEETFFSKGVPKLFLENFESAGKVISGDQLERISFNQNSITLRFKAIGFNQDKELWVHYRLLGSSDENWKIIRDPKSTKIMFSNLAPGDYQVAIKASYEGENFSNELVSQVFRIKRPFYLQFWFIIITILFLIGLGILINMFFRQLHKVGLLKTAFDTKEKEKRITEKEFKNVWDSSKDGLILTLDGKEIVTANHAFGSMAGIDSPELERKPMEMLFSDPDFYKRYLPAFQKRLEAKPGMGFTFEITIPWKKGPLEMEIFSILIQSEYEGRNLILSVFRDISAKKSIEARLKEAKEKAEQANRFKSSMLSNISHEIRTPLNGIIGGAEHIMMIRKNDPELISQLDIILQSGVRLMETIKTILDMARIEANKMEVAYSEVEINDFIGEVLVSLKNSAQRKGLVLSVNYLRKPFYGKIDKVFLEMILNNLIGNSIKYSEKGGIILSVDRRRNNLLLEIEDTGVGMSEDFLLKVFEPFEQESSGNDRLFEGTGLGLSITKNLIELLKGEIKISSTKNAGTLVTLEIPLPDA